MTSPSVDALPTRDGTRVPLHPLAPEWMDGLVRFNARLSAATRSMFWPHAYDLPTVRRFVERHRAGLDRSYVLVAEGDVVGYFFLWEFDQPVPLLGLGLADAWQGRGLGAAMLQHLLADARAAQRQGVELTSVTTNERAHRLYRRAGFVPLGLVENVAGDGRVVSEHRMFLPLAPGARPPAREFRAPA